MSTSFYETYKMKNRNTLWLIGLTILIGCKSKMFSHSVNPTNVDGRIQVITSKTYGINDTVKGQISETTIQKTSNSSVLEEWIYNSRDQLIYNYLFKYNNRDQLIERITQDGKGRKLLIELYEYNKKGFLSRQVNKDSNDAIWYRTEIFSDKKGRKIEEKQYDNIDKYIGKVTWKYTSDYTVFKEFDEEDKLTAKMIFQFNPKGHLIALQEWFDWSAEDRTYFFTYNYNDQGQWMVRKKYEFGLLQEIIERTFDFEQSQ